MTKVTKEELINDIQNYPTDTLYMRAKRFNLDQSAISKRIKKLSLSVHKCKNVMNNCKLRIEDLIKDVELYPFDTAANRAKRLNVSISTIYYKSSDKLFIEHLPLFRKPKINKPTAKFSIRTKERVLEDLEAFPKSTLGDRAKRLNVSLTTVNTIIAALKSQLNISIQSSSTKVTFAQLKEDIKLYPDDSYYTRAKRLGVKPQSIHQKIRKLKIKNSLPT